MTLGAIYTIVKYPPKPMEKMQARADEEYNEKIAKIKDGTLTQTVITVGPDTEKTFKKLKEDNLKVIATVTYNGSTTGFVVEKINP